MTDVRDGDDVADATRWDVCRRLRGEMLEAPDLDEPLAEMVGGRPVMPHPQEVDLGLDVECQPLWDDDRVTPRELLSRRPAITVIGPERATA